MPEAHTCLFSSGAWLVCLVLLASCATTAQAPNQVGRAEVASVSSPLSPLAKVSSAPIEAATVERVRERWQAVPGGFTRAVAVSSRLGLVVFNSDKTTRLYSIQSGKASGELNVCSDVVRSGMFFHGSRLLVVCHDRVERYDAATRKRLTPLEIQPVEITAAALSSGKLALAQRDGVIRVHDLQASVRVDVVVPGPPIDVKSLAFDAKAERLAVAWVQGSIWWWRLAQPEAFHKLVRHANESDSIAFAADGRFAEEGNASTTTLWTFSGDSEPQKGPELRNGAWVKRLLFTPDSKWLVRGGSDGLELAQCDGPKRLVLDSEGQVEDVALDETSSFIVSGDRVGRLKLFAVGRP